MEEESIRETKEGKKKSWGKTIKKWLCWIPKKNFIKICPLLHARKRDTEQTHWKRPSCWKRLRAGREGGNRGWDNWMASPTQWDMTLSKFWEIVKDRESWSAAVHRVAKRQTGLSDWTTTKVAKMRFLISSFWMRLEICSCFYPNIWINGIKT